MPNKKIQYLLLLMLLTSIIYCLEIKKTASTDVAPNGAKYVAKPSPRSTHAMVYDSNNQVGILFGGGIVRGRYITYDDTWTYDYANNTWIPLNPITRPFARFHHNMVYDSANQKVILFGGLSVNGEADDTWIYDYVTNQWTEVFPAVSPPARSDFSIIYDSSNQKVILFGGQISRELGGDEFLDDSWRLDYNIKECMDSNEFTIQFCVDFIIIDICIVSIVSTCDFYEFLCPRSLRPRIRVYWSNLLAPP
ncbi:MAG: kelch repeat-containing protein [Candidatus Hodarchaeota archaeon]